MFYDNIKSHKKTPEFHPLFGRYIFTEKPEGGGGSNWPHSLLRVKWLSVFLKFSHSRINPLQYLLLSIFRRKYEIFLVLENKTI